VISIERFQPEKHYESVCRWWSAQSWPIIPLSHLPQTGLVVMHEGMPAAAAWIYKTDSAFCLLEFIVANPEIRKETRTAILSTLISSAKVVAEVMGFQSIFVTNRNQSLGKRLEAQGFKISDQEMTNYSFEIPGRG
jgi:hypothetical protein